MTYQKAYFCLKHFFSIRWTLNEKQAEYFLFQCPVLQFCSTKLLLAINKSDITEMTYLTNVCRTISCPEYYTHLPLKNTCSDMWHHSLVDIGRISGKPTVSTFAVRVYHVDACSRFLRRFSKYLLCYNTLILRATAVTGSAFIVFFMKVQIYTK